jgi:hypothetical protein
MIIPLKEIIMKSFFVFIFCVLMTLNSQAKEHKGVNFADEVKVGTTNLKLNGTGVRTAMSIISVYVAGLYVATPSQDTDTIVNAPTPKRIDMHFLMSVGMDKLKEGWNEGFFRNAPKDYSYREDLNKFYASLKGMKNHDRVQLTFFPDKLETQVNEEPVVTIPSAAFSKTMLKVYIADIPDSGLKNGLLGKK